MRLGFEQATGDILMILAADITVPPEDLPRLYSLVVTGQAECVNVGRLEYPTDDDAMRFANLLGNKFFSGMFTSLLGQSVHATFCCIKILCKSDYGRIKDNLANFGDCGPLGGFDLLFDAAKFNLKIMEVPIRYRARTYGETNISRWSHGWLLLKMVVFAARRVKFV